MQLWQITAVEHSLDRGPLIDSYGLIGLDQIKKTSQMRGLFLIIDHLHVARAFDPNSLFFEGINGLDDFSFGHF